MPRFTELTARDCPLLGESAELVLQRFNEAVGLVRDIEQKYPRLLEREQTRERLAELERIRVRLQRQRYFVGFLGRTQDGKSTAFNNILDATEAEAPSQSGIGGATTSAVTRVRKASGENHQLVLRYLTKDEAEIKKKLLIDAAKIPTHWSDKEILQHLQARKRGTATAAELKKTENVEVLPEDYNNLESFLNSLEMFRGQFIHDKAVELSDIPYVQRSQYLNHAATSGKTTPASHTFLLKDAVIDFKTDKIPNTLEIIDLPGLGSQGSIDSLLTRDFLKELDGALVFIKAGQIDNEDVERVLRRFNLYWDDRLTGRVWIVLTFFDVLGKPALFGNPQGVMMLDTLHKLLERHRIPPEQVCFSSARFYQASIPGSPFQRDTLAALMGMQGSSIEEMVPPRFRNHPHWNQAFLDLLADGGIGRLRHLITNVLAGEVRNETRHQIERQLTPLVDRLRQDIKTWEQGQKATPTERLNAFRCFDRVVLELGRWKGRVAELDPLSLELKKHLLEQVDKFLPQEDRVLGQLSESELRQRLEFLAEGMKATVDHLLESGLIERAFTQASGSLADLPKVALDGEAGPLELWQHFATEDRTDTTWRERLPDFRCQHLFDEGLHLEEKSGYRSLMREKASSAAHQTMHALKVRIQQRLSELREELSKLAYDVNGTSPSKNSSGANAPH